VWPANRFAAVAGYLQQHYPEFRIVLTGASGEELYAQALLHEMTDHTGVEDLTGRLSLLQLISLLSKATLLIANETGTVHLAAAVNTPTIVISQGKSLVRWHPYPADVSSVIITSIQPMWRLIDLIYYQSLTALTPNHPCQSTTYRLNGLSIYYVHYWISWP
jgi:ADP-heptose:LPS heptosyltransferase